jgi:maltose alpha-D-glucosyltransferase/alpha-amylase
MLYQRSLYQSLRSLASQNLQLLRKLLPDLDADSRRRAEEVLQREEEIATRLRALSSRKIDALRIRIHGDFHLGQALYTGKDFVLIDFEGEPARTLSARRLKRSALVDVAGMLRSFDYAASAVLMGRAETAPLRSEDREALRPWALFWERWVAGAFLRAYLEKAREGEFLPRDRTQLALLLQACLLEKAIYEIGYEVQNRPDWVGVALTGVLKILARGEPVSEGGNES